MVKAENFGGPYDVTCLFCGVVKRPVRIIKHMAWKGFHREFLNDTNLVTWVDLLLRCRERKRGWEWGLII